MRGRARYYRGWRYIDAGGMAGYLGFWLVVGFLLALLDGMSMASKWLTAHPTWGSDFLDTPITWPPTWGIVSAIPWVVAVVLIATLLRAVWRDPNEAPVRSGDMRSSD